MKRLLSLVVVTFAAVSSAWATSYTFQPSDADLADFSHNSAYVWGISGTSETSLKNQLLAGYTITSATITIKNFYNWDKLDTSNQLFMHLLDNPKNGITTITDDPNDNGINQGVLSDYFSGKITTNKVNGQWITYGYSTSGTLLSTGNTNIYLTQYHDNDGPVTHINFSYSFTGNQLATLQQYISNGHTGGTGYADFGLGFDPDCHYYNDGVCLIINTTPPPIPDNGATVSLFGVALAALAVVRRRRHVG